MLFDDQLTQKWQALDFLACVDTNQTSRAFAIQAANGTGSPYELGTSQCELKHDPAYVFLPASASDINDYCQIPNSNVSALKGIMVMGSSHLQPDLLRPAEQTVELDEAAIPERHEDEHNTLGHAAVLRRGGRMSAGSSS